MKFRWDKKYLYWGLTLFLVIISCIGITYLLYNGTQLKTALHGLLNILMPILDGLIIAYLLSPIVNTLERKVLFPLYKKYNVTINRKTCSRTRVYSITITYLICFLVAYAFARFVIPQIYDSIINITGLLPTYYNNLVAQIEKQLIDNPELEVNIIQILEEVSSKMSTWLYSDFLPNLNNLLMTVSLSLLSLLKAAFNLVIGFIISVYLLYNKEVFVAQAKKVIYAVLERDAANNLIADCKFTNKTFGGFINGKLLDSLIIGILCFICISIIGTPYPILISVIIGITNIVPFFGPYLGAIPSAILILLIDPMQCLYFVLFILVLQQFDGNILGPKILGNSTGLSGFWVIFSITIFGGLFGIFGMVVGVPLFAVFYHLIKRRIHKSLEKRGYTSNTEAYKDLAVINENKQFITKEMLKEDTTIR